jgi:hypothetical protein
MSLADSHAKGNYIVGVKTSILGANVVNEARKIWEPLKSGE